MNQERALVIALDEVEHALSLLVLAVYVGARCHKPAHDCEVTLLGRHHECIVAGPSDRCGVIPATKPLRSIRGAQEVRAPTGGLKKCWTPPVWHLFVTERL